MGDLPKSLWKPIQNSLTHKLPNFDDHQVLEPIRNQRVVQSAFSFANLHQELGAGEHGSNVK